MAENSANTEGSVETIFDEVELPSFTDIRSVMAYLKSFLPSEDDLKEFVGYINKKHTTKNFRQDRYQNMVEVAKLVVVSRAICENVLTLPSENNNSTTPPSQEVVVDATKIYEELKHIRQQIDNMKNVPDLTALPQQLEDNSKTSKLPQQLSPPPTPKSNRRSLSPTAKSNPSNRKSAIRKSHFETDSLLSRTTSTSSRAPLPCLKIKHQ